ncbi:unnamed protein product [Clonostachys rosea]|uniref:Uncharacterized protein n=1 Tax=Bionectria ochroleuca TaxID=29856 RepID=A0ABY6TZL3_BIOOC|nr:unnamed protein product [Clonostachys rosea]
MYLQYPFFKATGVYSLLERLATADVQRYFNAVEVMFEKRVAEGKDIRHDFYSLVADEMNPKGEHSINSEIWAEAAFFFPAGGETTATLLSATFFYLAKNRDSYDKLASEIRSTFDTCEDISLRMSPPVSGTLWRELSTDDESSEPLMVDGHVMPPGTQVGLNMYTIHHNEQYFPEPYTFRPEPWLGTRGDSGKRMLDAWVPFSLGSRNCAGKAMAYQQSNLVLAKVLWYFDFKFAEGSPGRAGGGGEGLGQGRSRQSDLQLYEHIAATHDDPNLIFKPRKGVAQDFAPANE